MRVVPEDRPVIADGVYEGLDMDQYHEDPAISKTGLVHFAESPLHYATHRREPQEEKKHLSVGAVAHALILQPEIAEKSFAVAPAEVLAANGARKGKKYEAWEAAQAGRIILTQEMHDTARRIRDSVLEDPEHVEARLLLTSGLSEISVFHTDAELGIRIKVRPDHLPGAGIVADLKTARSANAIGFGTDSFRLKYHWSAALTLGTLCEVTGQIYDDYRFVVVENEAPFDVAIYKPERDQIQYASDEIDRLLEAYSKCCQANAWPGYFPETQALFWPRWAWRSIRPADEFNSYEFAD